MRHLAYLRVYETVISSLLREGHFVEVGFMPLTNKRFDTRKADEMVTSSQGRMSYSFLSPLPGDFWSSLKDFSRTAIDYLRYFAPEYETAHKLRERMSRRIPALIKFLIHILSLNRLIRHRIFPLLQNFLSKFESAFPTSGEVLKLWSEKKPDIVLFTPLLDAGMGMIDYAKGAAHLGLKTALCVASWDNLTNKGLIQADVDRVIVWNKFQKDEAVRFHHVPAERIRLTGAQVFDEWFERKPKMSKKDFCAKVGVPDGFIILYLCSSVFIAKTETSFIKKWLQSVRQSEAEDLRTAGIVIRPHPANVKQWVNADFSGFGNTVIWPAYGAVPIFEDTKDDYFHSLHYADVAVGLNTSAMIEAGILGKTVLTVEDEEFKDTQGGTLHYHYLVKEGLLQVARDLDTHRDQLVRALTENKSPERNRDFIRHFIRPFGNNVTGTSRFIAEMTELYNDPRTKRAKERRFCVLFHQLFLLPFAAFLIIVRRISLFASRSSKNRKKHGTRYRTDTPGGPIEWDGGS